MPYVDENTGSAEITGSGDIPGLDDQLAVLTNNVAGALMDSEVVNLEEVKLFNPTDYATAAQGLLAGTAVQPADLATVATTGAYGDVSGTPTLGTAAATDATDYATAAQGLLAGTAVQPTAISNMVESDPTGVTGADAITNMMSLTQAEYDAITPNASTLYVIV